jgi:UDP-2,3-diacylglucosamine hydrolase
MATDPPIVLLAGEGQMPARVLEGAREAGRPIFLLAVEEVTSPELADQADEVMWVRHLKLGRLRKECAQRGVEEMILAGRIEHSRIFSLGNLDFEAMKLIKRLPDMRANTCLCALADAVADWGITLISSVKYLQKYLAKPGLLTSKRIDSDLQKEIDFGARMAKELGRADVGQTVVVKNCAVVAVEAMEGTDNCLERAGEIAGKGCVVVKMPKPNQDMRFDVPVIGVNTIEKLAKIKARAIAIGAGRTLVVDPDTLKVADQLGVSVVSIDDVPLD